MSCGVRKNQVLTPRSRVTINSPNCTLFETFQTYGTSPPFPNTTVWIKASMALDQFIYQFSEGFHTFHFFQNPCLWLAFLILECSPGHLHSHPIIFMYFPHQLPANLEIRNLSWQLHEAIWNDLCTHFDLHLLYQTLNKARDMNRRPLFCIWIVLRSTLVGGSCVSWHSISNAFASTVIAPSDSKIVFVV